MKSINKSRLFGAVVFGLVLFATSICFAESGHGTQEASTHIKVQKVQTVESHGAVAQAHGEAVTHEAAADGHAQAAAHGGEAATAAHGGGHGAAHSNSLSPAKLKDLFWRTVNFAALVFILVYFGAKPIGNALSGRRQKIKDELEELQAKRDEAERSFKELEASLAGMEKEMEVVVARAIKQAEAEKAKILEDAERAAADIKKQAESAIQSELAAAKKALQEEVAEKAAVMAEELIVQNLTPEDHSNIIENYLDRVGAAQ